jgi:hypothetical protein
VNQDTEHLRLLSIFHYVVAGIGVLCSCFPFLYLTIGLFALLSPEKFGQGHPDVRNAEADWIFGLVFTILGAAMILIGWTISFCVFLAGRYLARRQHHVFCLVVAAVLCMAFPFGTVLGVFSIIVLIRPSVKAMFEQQPAKPLAS